jgi:hypothetical protein
MLGIKISWEERNLRGTRPKSHFHDGIFDIDFMQADHFIIGKGLNTIGIARQSLVQNITIQMRKRR